MSEMMGKRFVDIPGFETWKRIQKVDKGWSSDAKYKITTCDGEELLLRISDISQYEEKKKEYEMICKFSGIGFEMSAPKAFGTCNDGTKIYMLLAWVVGEDLEEALPNLPVDEQYRLGRMAGEILKSIHSLPLSPEDAPTQTKIPKKLLQIERYETSNLRVAGDETALQYVKDNLDKIWREPPCYLHGDFHPGNLILTPSHKIGVIDFNRWEVGDPHEEFYKLESFGVEVSVPYCIGQIDAYFGDNVPATFWETLAVYVAHAALWSIKWAEKFGQGEIDGMVTRCLRTLENYDGFNKIVPRWYEEGKKLIK